MDGINSHKNSGNLQPSKILRYTVYVHCVDDNQNLKTDISEEDKIMYTFNLNNFV